MQDDERDVLEVLKFDLMEKTVGSWLRAIIRRLEKEQLAIRDLRRQNNQRSLTTPAGRLHKGTSIREPGSASFSHFRRMK
jgi:hypothetical protein